MYDAAGKNVCFEREPDFRMTRSLLISTHRY